VKRPYGVLLAFAGFGVIFLTVGLLIYFYLKSPNVVTERWGGPAEFGQFGDMIGGLLNPMFGFITILIVLYTAHLQRNEMQRNKNLRDIESLYRLIEQSKSTFFTKLNEDIILDITKNEIYSFNILHKKGKIQLMNGDSIEGIISTIHKTQSLDALVELEGFDNNYFAIFQLIHYYRRVINHFKELISLEDFHYAKADIANQLYLFHVQTYRYHLITKEEDQRVSNIIKQYRFID
jgi:hypothetical protein